MNSGGNLGFRICKPKYSQLWASLILGGAVLIVGTRYIFTSTPEWVPGVGLLMTVTGLVVFVFGTIAARRDWEAERKREMK
jgi:drug/metabolite transporter (DMT)-like permease